MNLASHSRWKLAVKTLPYVVLIILTKFLVHEWEYEFLSLNSLFTAIISANIFLIGFLISGTLVDYKESEKLPGDLSASLESMADEAVILYQSKKIKIAEQYLDHVLTFNDQIIKWFYHKADISELMIKLQEFNSYFLEFEKHTQANFITRLKQEQNQIRKSLTRIHTIRETYFMGTAYAITEIITCILIFGLILVKITPFYESIFFVSFVSFILIYMIYFIKDLDNPFAYQKEESQVDEVSLQPLIESKKRIEALKKLYVK